MWKSSLKSAVLGSGLAVAVLMAGAGSAWAGAVITSGPVSLGINDEGHLNFFTATPPSPVNAGGFVGLHLAGVGDATAPGCLCEGWGVAGNGISGWGSVDDGGIVNLTVDSFGSTASTATSMVHLTSLPELSVTQAYAPSAGAPTALFEDLVTITNTSAAPITGITYRRVMDWDVPPTEFSEFVTIAGLPAASLLDSSDNGFATANPLGGGLFDLGGCGITSNFTDCGPDDHGALFDFGFGTLGPGESKSFSIFYGGAYSEADALAALGAVGAEVYSLGESSTAGGPSLGTPGTYIFGFKGVGGTPISTGPVVPEPSSIFLLGAGLAGLSFQRKKLLAQQ